MGQNEISFFPFPDHKYTKKKGYRIHKTQKFYLYLKTLESNILALCTLLATNVKYSIVRNITNIQHRFETSSLWISKFREGGKQGRKQKRGKHKSSTWENTRFWQNSGPIHLEYILQISFDLLRLLLVESLRNTLCFKSKERSESTNCS